MKMDLVSHTRVRGSLFCSRNRMTNWGEVGEGRQWKTEEDKRLDAAGGNVVYGGDYGKVDKVEGEIDERLEAEMIEWQSWWERWGNVWEEMIKCSGQREWNAVTGWTIESWNVREIKALKRFKKIKYD